MDAIEALKTRRCIRAYKREPVSRDVIEDIVDCGRLAATARNEQLWEFVVVTDPKVRASIAEMAPNGPFIADAPVCIVVLCQEGMYYLEDGCAATQNMLVAAHAHGLGACWVAGDKKPYAEAVLKEVKAPKGYRLVSLVSVGHVATVPHPVKKKLSDVLHWEQF